MKTAILVAFMGMLALASANSVMEAKFDAYLATFGKTYSTTEKLARRMIYAQNMETIAKLNKLNGAVAFGENMFTDLHETEFRSRFLGYKPKANRTGEVAKVPHAEIPSSKDWRSAGIITPVKNQAQCGSCWAFSATEQIESNWCQAGNTLVELSPQQIVSCDTVDQGCNGGDTTTAYQYVEQAGGLELNSDYPYTSGNGNSGQCKFNANDIVAKISGFGWATRDSDETVMKQYIGTTGPLSTCVDASTWQFYSGGIVQNNCGRQLDHCVQTIGYNSQDGTDYWIVRNSWTAGWGENGYIYIEIGQDLCGIADEPTYVHAA